MEYMHIGATRGCFAGLASRNYLIAPLLPKKMKNYVNEKSFSIILISSPHISSDSRLAICAGEYL